MSTNVVVFAWNRPIPGREQTSATHFQEFVGYLAGLQKSGAIAAFDPVFLTPHGGDMNGFFFIRGDNAKLDAVLASEEWVIHQMRAAQHLDGLGMVRGVTGDLLMQRMGQWTQLLAGS